MTEQNERQDDRAGWGNWYYVFVFSIPVLVIGALILMGLLSSNVNPRRMGGSAGMFIGAAMPDLQAEAWINGEQPTDDELKGKVVVVDAWATWCRPCRMEAPHMVEMYHKYKDRGVVFIGLTSEGPAELKQIRRFIDHFGIEWRNGYGAEGVLEKLGAEFIPQVWIFGPDGKLIWNVESSGPPEAGIEKALAKLPSGS